MKKLSILFLTVLFFISFSGSAFSANTAKAVEPTNKLQKDLIERVASQVAKMNLVEKRGTIGNVIEVSGTQIEVEDIDEKTRYIDVDELTKFYSSSSKTFGFSDIEKGDRIGVLGLYNKQSKRILAREIEIITVPSIISGVIGSIDEEGFTITVVTEKGKEIVDIQTITKTYSYTQDDDIEKSGFSKLVERQPVMAIGFYDKTSKNKLLASRILVFPEIPPNPKLKIAPNALEEKETVPSTGSGKKLTPINE